MDASQTDSQDAEKVLTQSSSNSGKADEAKGMDPRGKTLPKRDLEQEAARSARAASAAKAPSTASSKSVKRSSDLQLADAKGKKSMQPRPQDKKIGSSRAELCTSKKGSEWAKSNESGKKSSLAKLNTRELEPK